MVLLGIVRNKEMIMKTHKETCIAHAIARFEERFTEKDFTTKSKIWGEVLWKEEVLRDILNAKNSGHVVKGGKGYRDIYKIKVMDTKSVFVVWDMYLECAVTVLTGEMWTKTKDC
jgi:hypothetical protein